MRFQKLFSAFSMLTLGATVSVCAAAQPTAAAAPRVPAGSAEPAPKADTGGESPRTSGYRHPVELTTRGGAVLPSCSDSVFGTSKCDSTKSGSGTSVGLFWRKAQFGWGAYADFALFKIGGYYDKGEAASVHAGLVGRYYLQPIGGIEPYASLGVGRGILIANAEDEDGDPDGSVRRASWSVRSGFGFEGYISQRVRMGPALTYTRYLGAEYGDCVLADCEETGLGQVKESFAITVSATFGFGS